MTNSFSYQLIVLAAGIAVIVVSTTKYKLHAFYALLIACLLVGVGMGLPVDEVAGRMKDGFVKIIKSLGLIILLGTLLGQILEHTGATTVMASFMLKKIGEKRAPLAMGITGFIVGLPIFCDSGFIVLSGLNKSLAKRTGIPLAVMSVSLATGLYAIHCLAPPHPGATAAAATIGVDFGKLIFAGMLVAIPAMVVGYFWAEYAGKTMPGKIVTDEPEDKLVNNLPSLARAFIPVIVPIILIGLKSFLARGISVQTGWVSFVVSLVNPATALLVGVLLAFNCKRKWKNVEVAYILQEAVKKAAGILVIIGMGGAFGAILAASRIGDHFSQSLALSSIGVFFPFLVTSLLKTAQGSSTVAIITAAPIVLPLLPALGLGTETGKLLAVLAMGAGSMMVSHANDAYFWVIAKFSGLEMKTMLKVYSVATVLMGCTTMGVVYILSKVFL